MDALRNYLAWQAEMGGDEVVLAAPLILGSSKAGVAAGGRTSTVAATAVQSPGIPASISRSEFLEAVSATPAGLFEMLAKSLEDTQSAARDVRMKSSPMAALHNPPQPKAADASLPAFNNLEELRAFAVNSLRSMHTGDPDGTDWKVVHGEGPEFAPLALVGLEPGAEDGRLGRPFQGPGGVLLEKMMRAIKLDLAALYRTHLIKVAAPRRVWTRRDVVRLHPLFLAELALAKSPVVLLLGEACAQAVLKTGKPLEELSQRFHRVEGAPGIEFAATWHPDELEGKEELKRKAWKDLQWLQPRLQGN